MSLSEITDISETESHYEPLLSSQYSDSSGSNSRIKLFKNQVILNPTISKKNFFTFLLYDAYLGFVFLPLTLLQNPLLRLKYDVTIFEERADVTLITNTFRVLFKVAIASKLAYCCDRFGRRTMITLGILLSSLSAFMMPNLPNIYPMYPVTLLILDTGLLSMQSAPLLADYIDYETKGRVSGITVVISFGASAISTYASENIDLTQDVSPIFYLIGTVGLILGLTLVAGLKGGLYHKHKKLMRDKTAEEARRRITTRFLHDQQHLNDLNNAIQPNAAHKEMKPGFKAGIREAKNPWILTGYICTFLFMQNHALFGFILISHVTHLSHNPSDVLQAYALNNRHMVVALMTALIFGFYADKKNKFKIIMFSLVCSMIGVTILIITESPFNFITYLSMVFLGISSAGYKTIVSQLLGKYATPKFRASVVGVESIFSVVGAASSNVLGVYLTKEDTDFPFVMNLACSVMGLSLLGLIYASKKEILEVL